MGERKVLNKYYPPDFDPTKIPRRRRPKNEQYTVRMMVPMSIRCLSCGEYIYKGKKFNSKKETVIGEDYHRVKIFRFYIKCPRCSSEITIKTDPKNSDYSCEMGATRNLEGWREGEKKMEEFRKKREEEEEGNLLKAIEHKAFDSKREMEIADALDEIRTLNARQSKVDPLDLLEHITPVYKHQDSFEFDMDELKLIEEMEEKEKEMNRLENNEFTTDELKLIEEMEENEREMNRLEKQKKIGLTQDEFKAPLPRRPLPKRVQSLEHLVIVPGKNLRFK